MNNNHFKLMKLALETESKSAHETHKVGALLISEDNQITTKPNFWPVALEKHIGRYEKLGNASTTVHAEMAVICASKAIKGGSIYVTDLPCPNCSKLIAQARISNVYIDSHTHNTPLGLKIKPYFDDISTLIFKSADIAVYEINEQNKTIDKIVIPNPNALVEIHKDVNQVSIEHRDINKANFLKIINAHKTEKTDETFAACYAKNSLGNYSFLFANVSHSLGLSQDDVAKIKALQDKYEPSLQPINRLLVDCAKYGLKIEANYLYSSQIPTAREFVNMLGAGYNSLYIGDKTKCRDKWGLKAFRQLEYHNIITCNVNY